MIQYSRFDDGAFVLHKIGINGRKYSAWYREDGEPYSAELVMKSGDTRAVAKRSRKIWGELAAWGRVYANTERVR